MSVTHSSGSRTSLRGAQINDVDIEKYADAGQNIGEKSEESVIYQAQEHKDQTTRPRTEQSTLERVITDRSNLSYTDPAPPPDGGFRAWLTVGAGFCVIFNSWGYIQTFGVFQTYYLTILDKSPSTISWIGSIQIFLLFILAPFSGRATDAGYFRPVFMIGLLMQLLGIFMSSLATKYWQVFLTQGVCQGIGNGLQFAPTMSLVSTYFDKNRSLAIGLTAVGAAIGGLVMPGDGAAIVTRDWVWLVR